MRADIRHDGVISIFDLGDVATTFGTRPLNPLVDQDGDGIITVFDLAAVAGLFGRFVRDCPKGGIDALPNLPPLKLGIATNVYDSTRFLLHRHEPAADRRSA